MAARTEMHNEIIRRFWAQLDDLKRSRHAIVMAGPPGAGKSSTLSAAMAEAFLSTGNFAIVDSDKFKRELLQSSIEDGTYRTHIVPQEVENFEASGEVFFPLDFASLVHTESVYLADIVIEQALELGANVVIDGTLSSAARARETFRKLTAAGYSIQLIVDVETSRNVAEDRAYKRWLSDYETTLEHYEKNGELVGLGGRLVPPAAFDWIYSGPGGLSLPLITAKTMEHEFQDVVRLMVYCSKRSSAIPDLEYDTARGGGIVHTDTAGSEYATCTVCHRSLTSPESIAAGMGPSCAERLAAEP